MKTNDTYTAAILCTVAGINDIDVSRHSLQAWRTAGFLGPKNADQDGGWTRYSFDDLLGACALAEVSRFGVTFKTPLVANELAKQLRSIFKSDLSKKPIYLFADQQLSSGKDGMLGVSSGHPFEALRPYFTRLADDDHECATALVIDAAKVARRIEHRLSSLGAALPGKEKR